MRTPGASLMGYPIARSSAMFSRLGTPRPPRRANAGSTRRSARCARGAFSAEETPMSYTVLNKDDLERSGTDYDFQGYLYDAINMSFIWVDLPPGGGPRLHKHP